eukprot:EG_transcript_11947
MKRSGMSPEEEKRWAFLKEHPSYNRKSSKSTVSTTEGSQPKKTKTKAAPTQEDPTRKRAPGIEAESPASKKARKSPPEEVTDLAALKPLVLDGLRWSVEGRVFAHTAAAAKYKALFRKAKAGYELVLRYKDNLQHCRTVVLDCSQHITALRFSERAPPSLLLWCISPLPPAFMVKAQREAQLAAMQARIQAQQSEPEWALALLFPAKEQERFRTAVRLLRETCFAAIQDTAALTPSQAARLPEATAEAVFVEATGERLPRQRAFRLLSMNPEGLPAGWELQAVPYAPSSASSAAAAPTPSPAAPEAS